MRREGGRRRVLQKPISYDSATVRSDPGNVVPTAVRLMMTGVSGPIEGVPVAEPTVEPAVIVTVNSSVVPAYTWMTRFAPTGACFTMHVTPFCNETVEV